MSLRLFAALVLAVVATATARAQLIDGVAAVIGDDVILLSDVNRASRPAVERFVAQNGEISPEVLRSVRAEALKTLIDQSLISGAAERMRLETSAEEIDFAIANIAREEGAEVEQVYEAAARQGLDRERYRTRLAEQIARMKVIDTAVRARATVGQDEIEELYQERYASRPPGQYVRVRHILIPWQEEGPRDASREMAAAVRKMALDGAPFSDLARRFSIAPSAGNGGLTVFYEKDVSIELAPHVFELGPGEISPAIETQHGINILQIIDRFDPSTLKLADVRRELSAELAERKMEPELERFLAELRKSQYIKVVAPELQ